MTDQLSVLDTMFLELEQSDAGAHMHIGIALVFDPLPGGGAPSLEDLERRGRERIPALPRFSQRLSSTETSPLSWLTWEPVESFDLAGHLHHQVLPAPGDDEQLERWLADFWSHRLDRRLPLWEVVLLEGLTDGRWALAVKTHHCLVDGVGSIDIGRVLLDDMPAPPTSADVGEPPAEGGGRFWLTPSVVIDGARAIAGLALHPRETFGKARAAAELIASEQLVGAPQTSLNGQISGTRDYATVDVPLSELKTIKNALGGTVNDVVLAACAGGLRELLLRRGEEPPAGLRAQVPVNIRSRSREGRLGNELTSLFVELPVELDEPLARFEYVRDRALELKSGSQRTGGKALVDLTNLAPPLAGGLLGRAMFGGSRMFNLTITNVPGPQQQLAAFGAPLVRALPFVPLFSGHTVGIAVASYDGQVVFGLTADRIGLPDLDVLAEAIERELAELGQLAHAHAG